MHTPGDETERLQILMHGALQGVGFRPHAYRLARELSLSGWVRNTTSGVELNVEGPRESVDSYLARLRHEAPPRASVYSVETTRLDPVGYMGFEILESAVSGSPTAIVLPDIATCPDCLAEVLDPGNRRYRYPFTNCTNCGPRFSIVEALPYDRPNTTMKAFAMCPECRAEYEDPGDRRFHAQPNACPACGPRVELWNARGVPLARDHDAIVAAADRIRRGEIIALKGIGGFHLLVNAMNEGAVRRLRERKHREEKPLAVMFPGAGYTRAWCHVDPAESRLLDSPAAPIVLLGRRDGVPLAPSVAPGNPRLGAMLPYTPLHHLLMREIGHPVVATSGNMTDEPICTDERDALDRLGGVADVLLVHDRPIARHVDDSVVRIVAGREQIVRRARGYAPLPIRLPRRVAPTLAVGGHLKNTVALAVGDNAFVSQHIGDLETEAAFRAFEAVIGSLTRLYHAQPEAIVCDLHPEYLSSQYARRRGVRVLPVQHHLAHVMACMVDNDIAPPVLGVSWDGTGYGTDGTVWGGEVFAVTTNGHRRAAHFRTFPLPGGEQAIREPRRAALGLLYELCGGSLRDVADSRPMTALTGREVEMLTTMMTRSLNCPRTSSAGRLFDALASILGIRHVNQFEGQAAMELEYLATRTETDAAYRIPLAGAEGGGPIVLDWGPAILEILRDVGSGVPDAEVAARFHNALAHGVVDVARVVGIRRVALSGGCFQNALLTERTIEALRRAGFVPYWHQRIAPNDGGIALGQIATAIYQGDIDVIEEGVANVPRSAG